MEALGYSVANLQNVIFFLLPGLLTVLLFYYQVPDRRKTDLTVIVLSVIASVSLTYATTFSFFAINNLFQQNFSATGPWFETTKILLSVLLAILLARFVESSLFLGVNKKVFTVKTYPFGRLWNTFFKVQDKTVVKVLLLNGSAYIGILSKSSFDPNDEVQELELAEPYTFEQEKAAITKIQETESVLILGSAIMSVEKITLEEARKLYNFPAPRKKRK